MNSTRPALSCSSSSSSSSFSLKSCWSSSIRADARGQGSGISRRPQKHRAHVLPGVDSPKARFVHVVRGGEQNPLALKALKVPDVVVDEEIGGDDGFVPAKHDVGRGNEREVLLEPKEFRRERDRHFHRG